MGIRQTLSAIGFSLVAAFSFGAQAQQPRAQDNQHCQDGMINTAALAKKLFATPVEQWTDAFLSTIGAKNMRSLMEQVGALQRELAKDIKEVDRAIHNDKKAINWEALVKNTHISLHETLAKAKQGNWGVNEWHAQANVASSAYVALVQKKLAEVKQDSNPAACPTTSTP